MIATSGALPEGRCHSDHLPLSADFNGVPGRLRPRVEPHLKIRTEAGPDANRFPIGFRRHCQR
jgi:hypothetical protein